MQRNTLLSKRVTLLFFAMLLFSVGWAQRVAVSGVVKDVAGEPVIGASVVVTGTSTGTVTDLDGKFRLEVPAGSQTLDITYVGMKKQTVRITGAPLSVVLETEARGLDELVVVGYGVVKKRDLTGSVSSVKSTEILKTSTSNAMQAMQARVPGLDIQQSNGQAGAGLSIRLRGNRSISASNDPLILVDGVEYGSTLDLNPSDIESMEVLKDASSTAIYGTRGSNGVILITTKRGQAGTSKVSVNTYLSSNRPTNIPQVMYGDREVQRLIDKANYQADAKTGAWGTSNLTPEQVLTETLEDFTEIGIYTDKSYTDWLDIILQNGMTKNIELSVSGGTDKTNFLMSLGGMFEEGLMKDDLQDRYNVKTNLDHAINKYLKVGAGMLFTYKNRNARNSGVFGQSLKMTTITHPYRLDNDAMIKTPNPRYAAHSNPLLDEIPGAFVNGIESTRLFGNGYVQVTPFRGLVFKSLFAVDRQNSRNGTYQDYESVSRFQSPATSYMSSSFENRTDYTWENTLNYVKVLDVHEFTGLVGHSMKQDVYESTRTFGDAGKEHFYNSTFYDLSKITTPKTETGFMKSSLLSYFGRLNYKLLDKYLLTASVRADGSSTLAPGKKWGYFPSTAIAWRLNEEDFLSEANWLDNLKLRASWGISGNAAVPAYGTMTTLSLLPVYYYMNGTNVPGNLPSSMGNNELTWEKTTSTNLGIDFGIVHGRISGSIDYYFNYTNDLLYRKSAPASSVYPSVLANIGETRGRGLEISLNTLLAQSRKFSWDINWTYSTATDEIVNLSDGVDRNISGNTGQIVGMPVSIFYDYEDAGNWNVGEFATYQTDWLARNPGKTLSFPSGYGTPGTLKIADKNDDGILNDDDKMVYNRSPKHIFGMNNSITMGDFSLSFLVYARMGGYISYDMNTQLNYESANWGDLDYWTPTNIDAKFPSPGAPSAIFASYGSSLRYEIADYIKIKEISLSYSLPASVLKPAGISNLKVYGALKNFFTFSKIDNYDPERGGDVSFPLAKQIVVGLNLEL
jgi:TonB-linked SusC/RagA family outer membrane protein